MSKICIYFSQSLPFPDVYVLPLELQNIRAHQEMVPHLSSKGAQNIGADRLTWDSLYVGLLNNLFALQVEQKSLAQDFMYRGISLYQFAMEALLYNRSLREWMIVANTIPAYCASQTIDEACFLGALPPSSIRFLQKFCLHSGVRGEFHPFSVAASRPSSTGKRYAQVMRAHSPQTENLQGKTLFVGHPRHLLKSAQGQEMDAYMQPLVCLTQLTQAPPLRLESPHWYQLDAASLARSPEDH
ncbi:MAG TPA: hypothetical protein VLM37_03850, partial [Fibrobacteraceae bacterium]|nr:hypothetical protein [Fibrobacteraceae bacterium]